MVIVIASIEVADGKREEFLEIFRENVPKVRQEKGCVEYLPAVDVEAGLAVQALDPLTVTVVERWATLEALHEHLKAPHMLEYREKVKDLVKGVSLKVLQQA